MPNARIALARGLVDGVNTKFYAPVPYVPRSTAYILNGRFHAYGNASFGVTYSESDPDSGEITVDVAPEPGDVVQIFFSDRYVQPETPVIKATVSSGSPRIAGSLRAPAADKITGAPQPRLVGTIRGTKTSRLAGTPRAARIRGVIKETC